MPRASPIQTSFNAGEFAPELDGRVDIAKYGNACRRMENFFPLVQGPARRRGGTKFVQQVKSQANRTWLARFEYNATQSYVLEFGNLYVRFYTDNGVLLEATQNISAITKANPGVLTYSWSGTPPAEPANGEWFYLSGIAGMTELNGRTVIVANVNNGANTFELTDTNGTNINTTNYTTYSSGGTIARVYTVTTPYTTADLINADGGFALQIVQSGDVLYICHPSYAPRKLSRTSATSWTLSTVSVEGGPFNDVDPDNTVTVYASAATGAGVTLTASSSTFASTDVGRLFYLESKKTNDIAMWETGKAISTNDLRRSNGVTYKALNTATTGTIRPTHTSGAAYDGTNTGGVGVQWDFQDAGYGWVEITGYTSATVVTCTVVSRLPDQVVLVGNATTRWAFGAWGSVPGYPSHVTFFKDRLVFARASDRSIWLSVAADYENFRDRDDGGEVVADMAVTIGIDSEQANAIQYLATGDSLVVGTAAAEYLVKELTDAEPFGPGNVTVVQSSEYGCRGVQPVRVGGSVVFVQRSGRKLREITYDALQDAHKAVDLSIFAPHLVPKGRYIRQMAFQKEPHNILWCVRDDGQLLGFTLNREQDVTGWHRHTIGGSGIVESIVTVPSPDNDRDDLWLVVRRTINGGTKRYVERMVPEYESGDAQEDCFYLDSFLTYDGAAATTISGLEHLEGETVTILADGATHPLRTVTNGAITLARAASVVHVGFNYSAKLATMRLNAGAAEGTAQGRVKRIHRMTTRMMDTLGGGTGPSETNVDEILFRSASDPMDAPPPIFTGDKVQAWPGDYERDAYVWYVNDDPLPATIIAFMPELSTQG